MNKVYIALASLTSLAAAGSFCSCSDELDVTNPNTQTTADFGDDESELEEALIAVYNRIRLEGTFARVGYTMDAVRGDEVWNASQVWYLPYDNLNVSATDEIGCQWIWRDCFHVVNRANFVLQQVEKVALSQDSYNKIKGQALFLRSLAFYTIATYQQTLPLTINYADYATLEGLYASSASYDDILDQIEIDFADAMAMLPSRNAGGDFAKGRATCGAAAGYLARTLMLRHKYSEALSVLNDIIDGKYGTYRLMADFGDNFRETSAYENNDESLFEVQFMDYGTGGTDEEWTPTNISKEATQGHAVESNYGPNAFGSWADLAAAPWLYNLFKAEKCTDGRLDPRLFWTISSYESEYDSYTGQSTAAYPNGDPRRNILYNTPITSADEAMTLSNSTNGGLAIAKWTYARGTVDCVSPINTITTGLRCGINLRLMRYSDVLLRAAECENEVNGPNQRAIDLINQVRNRVALPSLKLEDFTSADKLFEQIANVERPKEFGCENGRGIDLIRWGFFADAERFAQLKEHCRFVISNVPANAKADLSNNSSARSSLDNYIAGHEYFPIAQTTLDNNPNLSGNCANESKSAPFSWSVRPITSLD